MASKHGCAFSAESSSRCATTILWSSQVVRYQLYAVLAETFYRKPSMMRDYCVRASLAQSYYISAFCSDFNLGMPEAFNSQGAMKTST